jgi:hypothetical protein
MHILGTSSNHRRKSRPGQGLSGFLLLHRFFNRQDERRTASGEEGETALCSTEPVRVSSDLLRASVFHTFLQRPKTYGCSRTLSPDSN